MRPVPSLVAAALAIALLVPSLPAAALGATPRVVALSGAANALATSGDGSLVSVGTADGVFGFSAAGDQRFHALAAIDVLSVAVDQDGGTIVAGDSTGIVHVLDGAGNAKFTAITTGAAQAVDVTPDGTQFVVGGADGMVWSFNTAMALTPPLPQPPANPAGVLLYQWAYKADAAPSAVHITADGLWANAATQVLYAFSNDPAFLPALNPRLPCSTTPLGPKCWFVEEFAAGGVSAYLAWARNTYDILAGWTNSPVQAEFANTLSLNGRWEYFADTTPSAGAASDDGARFLAGESLGTLKYLDNARTGCCSKAPIWSVELGSRVTHAALSGKGGAMAAASTADKVIRAWSAASGSAPMFAYTASGPVAGLAWTPDGSRLTAAAGSDALFWG